MLADFTNRIAARRWAEECVQAIDDKKSFLERVQELVDPKPTFTLIDLNSPKHAMTDEEAKAFELEHIPFGAHRWQRIGRLELSYLVSLTDPSPFVNDWMEKIRRYLRSPSIRKMLMADQDYPRI